MFCEGKKGGSNKTMRLLKLFQCEASGNVTVSTGFLDSRLKTREVGFQGSTGSTKVHCTLGLLPDDSVGTRVGRRVGRDTSWASSGGFSSTARSRA